MRMSVAVVSDIVTATGYLSDVVGIFFYPVSDKEECRLCVVLVKNIQQLSGLLVAPKEIATRPSCDSTR